METSWLFPDGVDRERMLTWIEDSLRVLRKGLRAFDLVYRIGGEEFLVLVPGAHVRQAAELAEPLRLQPFYEAKHGGRTCVRTSTVDPAPTASAATAQPAIA
jgi:hypothetical protein